MIRPRPNKNDSNGQDLVLSGEVIRNNQIVTIDNWMPYVYIFVSYSITFRIVQLFVNIILSFAINELRLF